MHYIWPSFDTESVPVDVPLKDMNPGADDPKQNNYDVGNSDGDANRLHKNLSDILVRNNTVGQCDCILIYLEYNTLMMLTCLPSSMVRMSFCRMMRLSLHGRPHFCSKRKGTMFFKATLCPKSLVSK
jgi:hypothetical protein